MEFIEADSPLCLVVTSDLLMHATINKVHVMEVSAFVRELEEVCTLALHTPSSISCHSHVHGHLKCCACSVTAGHIHRPKLYLCMQCRVHTPPAFVFPELGWWLWCVSLCSFGKRVATHRAQSVVSVGLIIMLIAFVALTSSLSNKMLPKQDVALLQVEQAGAEFQRNHQFDSNYNVRSVGMGSMLQVANAPVFQQLLKRPPGPIQLAQVRGQNTKEEKQK